VRQRSFEIAFEVSDNRTSTADLFSRIGACVDSAAAVEAGSAQCGGGYRCS
jgi:hypothetical protein